MKIQESAENYLETILILQEKSPNVRSIDIAAELDFTKASVSIAMKKLRENDFIAVDKDGYISLTKAGKTIAEKMYERHTLISRWLIKIGVSEEIAVHDACRMEHILSKESFSMIKKHVIENNEL